MTGANAVALAYTIGLALLLGYALRVWLLQRRLHRRIDERSPQQR